MSTRNLEHFFRPKSVALIGASDREATVGYTVARNLLTGGYEGKIFLVNPRKPVIDGHPSYASIEQLPEVPEIALIATPAQGIPSIVDQLGALGTKAAVIISAGFGEGDNHEGYALQQQLLEASRRHLMRIVGPNCLGIINPLNGLNASFCHINPPRGNVAFITQSGAIMTAIADWASARGIGFSHMVSLGDMSDVDFGDLMDYLTLDPHTKAILLYIEGIRDARKFISAARIASRVKPVIVVKGGSCAQSAQAARSHTGSMAGSDSVYDAIFRRSGILRVKTLSELFDAAETLSFGMKVKGNRLLILTNGGGVGILATDALIDFGGQLAELSQETITALDEAMPGIWSQSNPVDIRGDANAARYGKAVEICRLERNADAVLVLNCPTAVVSSIDTAKAVAEANVPRKKPMLANWLGASTQDQARQILHASQISAYDSVNDAVHAFMHMADYQRSQKNLLETTPSWPEEFTPDLRRVREMIPSAHPEARWLDEATAKEVLKAYEIDIVPTLIADDPQDAAMKTRELSGQPVALKILSPLVLHKSDFGGVALNLASPEAALQAASIMQQKFFDRHPEAEAPQFTVQPMVNRSGSYELILGVTTDPVFGPIIVFGEGGVAVEQVKDVAFGLPPLTMALATDLVKQTKIFTLLKGYRNIPPVNLDELYLTLVKLSQLVTDIPEITEIDINPLLAHAQGVVALDARIRIEPYAKQEAHERLAIRPYPKDLEENITLPDGREVLLRPIRPEDEPAMIRAFALLSEKGRRLRFFSSMRGLPHELAARLSQIDYEREMALVVCTPGLPGQADVAAGVRIVMEPNRDRAEFAITVLDEFAGQGLGTFLMKKIIRYGRSQGLTEIYGTILHENKPMQAVCRKLGFSTSYTDEPGVVLMKLSL